jgi:hypothetical protein
MTPIDAQRLAAALDYAAYAEKLAAASGGEEPLDEQARQRAEYIKLNWHRSRRIEKTYEVGAALAQAVATIGEEQTWLVLTEPWCGDSAQNLPYIAKIAAGNPRVTLRILLRDENLDIMDRYLSDGKRGIPKLVAFDRRGRELFRWGPRPQGAAEVVAAGRAAGKPKAAFIEDLHRWYAADRGRSLEREFLALLQR